MSIWSKIKSYIAPKAPPPSPSQLSSGTAKIGTPVSIPGATPLPSAGTIGTTTGGGGGGASIGTPIPIPGAKPLPIADKIGVPPQPTPTTPTLPPGFVPGQTSSPFIPTATRPGTPGTRPPPTEVKLHGGGVIVDGVKYTGNIVVPGTGGQTANQIRKNLALQYQKETGGEYVSPSRLQGSAFYEQEFQERQQSAAELVFGGGDELGGALVTGRQIGRTGEEAEAVFEVPPESIKPIGFKERVVQKFPVLFDPSKAVIISKYDPMSILTTPRGDVTGTRDFTLTDVKNIYKTAGLPGKVVSEFVPTTVAGAGVFVIAPSIFTKLPLVARVPVGTTIAGLETRTAFDISQTPERRISAGIIAGLAGAGTVFEATPFARGFKARISPKFKPTKLQPEKYKAIEKVSVETLTTRIGLIPPKSPARIGTTRDVQLPSISPLVRGGFGRKPGGESIFLGQEQFLATSQRGMFVQGKDIRLQKEFFVTPQEPTLRIPITRESRLGLIEPFTFPRDTQLGFGLPPRPQIGITRAGVGRRETPTQFILGKGTELEAIKTTGVITDVQKVGKTVINLQEIELFTFRVGKDIGSEGKAIERILTTKPTQRISGEATLATLGLTQRIAPTSQLSLTSQLRQFTQTKTITIKTPTLVTSITTRPTRTTGTTGTPTFPTTIITPPITPPRSPPISPPISPPLIPPATPPFLPPKSPPLTPPKIPPVIPPKKPPKLKPQRKVVQPFGKFPVLVRRFGQFRIVGFGRTPGEAALIGKGIVSRTLAATFKVPSFKGTKVRGFRTKKEKEGIVFIEPRKRRLGTKSEVAEIQGYLKKSVKGGRRKKKK